MGGLFRTSKPTTPAPATIPSPDDGSTENAAMAERERRARRRGGLATILSSYGRTTGAATGAQTTGAPT